MSTGGELNDRIVEAYDAVMRDGTVAAVSRDAVKDVRSTIMEFFFGKPDRGSEPNTPLNPLFYDIVAARNSHGAGDPAPMRADGPAMEAGQGLPTPSQVIDNPKAYLPEGPAQQRGNAASQEAAPDLGRDTPPGHDSPTPSQVIDNPKAYLPEPQQNGQEHEHGIEM